MSKRIEYNILKNSYTKVLGDFFWPKDFNKIIVQDGSNIDLLIYEFPLNNNLEINIKNNAFVRLSILAKSSEKELNISAKIGQNSKLECYFADFSCANFHLSFFGELLGKYSSINCHVSSLTNNDFIKDFNINILHKNIHTFASTNCYGVVRDNGKLTFSGESKIFKGSYGSKTSQNAQIMVFDSSSIGKAKPILSIDENDIEANHSIAVGKINDEHIFYLTSRGLNIDEAKKLITFGYLKPILTGFNEEKYKKEILNIIEKGI